MFSTVILIVRFCFIALLRDWLSASVVTYQQVNVSMDQWMNEWMNEYLQQTKLTRSEFVTRLDSMNGHNAVPQHSPATKS